MYHDGQIERANEVLNEGLELSRGMSFFQSHLHLLAAFFALEREDDKTAQHLLSEGFSMAASQGYLNFMPWQDEIMLRLCREALAAGIEVDYVTRLASCHGLEVA